MGVKKEICSIKLDNGMEIKIEREIYNITLKNDIVNIKLVYHINSKKDIISIESILSDTLAINIQDIRKIFKPDNVYSSFLDIRKIFKPDNIYSSFLEYKVSANINDLDSLKAKIEKKDKIVISKVKWIIEQANKINKVLSNI